MTAPIEQMLKTVEWTENEEKEHFGELPYATHSGVLYLGENKLRCYRLNTGMAVFDADDFEEMFAGILQLTSSPP
jgi:hypothetical protein